ncbi:MAG TPA: hypothetical protein VND95_17500 [Stellaceae bacterium]|nr:hypothetical protein [Stellaceae bacterium]
MPPIAIRAALGVLLLGLTGCAGGPPWPEAASRDAITLRWYPDEISAAEAQQVAEAHCAPARRIAAIAAVERDGSAEIATYRCRRDRVAARSGTRSG